MVPRLVVGAVRPSPQLPAHHGRLARGRTVRRTGRVVPTACLPRLSAVGCTAARMTVAGDRRDDADDPELRAARVHHRDDRTRAGRPRPGMSSALPTTTAKRSATPARNTAWNSAVGTVDPSAAASSLVAVAKATIMGVVAQVEGVPGGRVDAHVGHEPCQDQVAPSCRPPEFVQVGPEERTGASHGTGWTGAISTPGVRSGTWCGRVGGARPADARHAARHCPTRPGLRIPVTHERIGGHPGRRQPLQHRLSGSGPLLLRYCAPSTRRRGRCTRREPRQARVR